MAKIYFSNFDSKKINAGGWGCEEGKLCLKITCPLGDKSIDALDEALDNKKFRYVGEVNVKDFNEAWNKIQNVYKCHELNDRSMMIGDVIIIGNEGSMVESAGFSKLSESQLQRFKNI